VIKKSRIYFWVCGTEKGFFGLRRTKAPEAGCSVGRKLMKPGGELNRRRSVTFGWVLFAGSGGKSGRGLALRIDCRAAAALEGMKKGCFGAPNSRFGSGPRADFRAGGTPPAHPARVPGWEWVRVRAGHLHELLIATGGSHSRRTSLPVPHCGQHRHGWRVSVSNNS